MASVDVVKPSTQCIWYLLRFARLCSAGSTWHCAAACRTEGCFHPTWIPSFHMPPPSAAARPGRGPWSRIDPSLSPQLVDLRPLRCQAALVTSLCSCPALQPAPLTAHLIVHHLRLPQSATGRPPGRDTVP